MEALIAEAETAGFWKLVSRVFPENAASLQLLHSLGFRQVGIYARHARLDGVWRDVVIVERLIPCEHGPVGGAVHGPRTHSAAATGSSGGRPRRSNSTRGRQQRKSTPITAKA